MSLHIDLWLWPLDQPTDRLSELSTLLSPDEAARARRFVNQRHGDHFVAGRGRLREILSGYCAVPAATLRFSYNEFGKPAVPDGPAFNLSHSAGWAALAVTDHAPLGIDIERFRVVEDGVARRFFAPREYATLSALPASDWNAGFFRCWTRKEAMVKACGPGLSMPLDSFDVTLAPADQPKLERLDGLSSRPEDWTLLHLDLAADFVGALAVETYGQSVEIALREGAMPLPAT